MPSTNESWPPKTDALFARERQMVQQSLRAAEAELDRSIRATSILALGLVYTSAAYAFRIHAATVNDCAVLSSISSCVWACLWQIRSIRSGRVQPALCH